ncbi:MAG: SDR family NAD(P)-dependent oxidoreductase [Nocardioides sp.]
MTERTASGHGSGGEAQQTALVTGATDGIGRATAQALSQDGWLVGVLGRNPERTRAVVEDISRAGGTAYAVVADLTSMHDTRRAVDQVLAAVDRLDVLLLNANHITQERVVTPEGFEANLAIGWLSRVLMMRRLEPLLAASSGQVLSVVGMNLGRIDTDDLSLPGSPGGMASLGQWQWAIQTYLRAWNERGHVPANTYMPGLVKTKILADEPGRLQRAAIKVAMQVVATTPDVSARHVVAALQSLSATGARDHYVSVKKDKGVRDLALADGDIDRIWRLSHDATERWVR